MKKILSLIVLAVVLGVGYFYYQGDDLPSLDDLWELVVPEELVVVEVEKANDPSNGAQKLFLEARGNPDVYMILFSDARLDETGKPVLRDEPTRVETWTFDAPDNVVASFENGYYLDEEPTGLTIDVQDHELSPLSFNFNTSKQVVKDIMGGEPDCVTSADAGPHTIEVMKYESEDDRPGGSFSFSDEQIFAVSVGVGYSEFPDKLCE